jgi:hypothetical protein
METTETMEKYCQQIKSVIKCVSFYTIVIIENDVYVLNKESY